MPTIRIDGRTIESREGIPVLQAALEAGWDIPHYCYHPGLSVVASCRLCLMEMKLPNPRTRELEWAPRLFPSCQTPVREGLEVRFDSPVVHSNQRHCMEYYLLNHPLDCPVCDKAGECYLQDYSERFGSAASRMVEEKYKNPKKDIGPRTLLYQDRCVMCTRCVRFCDEIAGTGELTVVNRGSRCEIDVFPGLPLENPLQGNVVDLCPVGCLLDKGFLFQRRVWELRPVPSVCPGCARGCTVHVDQADHRVYRLRPRFNEKVNEWWMCDEGRFGWKYVHSPERLARPLLRRGADLEPVRWEDIPDVLRFRLAALAPPPGGSEAPQRPAAQTAVVLSPMLACEEAWLLARFARGVSPDVTLVPGFTPRAGADQVFPRGFRVLAEKCPNRRGVETIIGHLGGKTATFDDFVKRCAAGEFRFVYLTAGYPGAWVAKELRKALEAVEFLVLHDLFASPLTEIAGLVIPGAAWVERDGCFMNADGLVQPFERAVRPLEGVKRDGQFFHELAGGTGLYRAGAVRDALAQEIAAFRTVHVPRREPPHAH